MPPLVQAAISHKSHLLRYEYNTAKMVSKGKFVNKVLTSHEMWATIISSNRKLRSVIMAQPSLRTWTARDPQAEKPLMFCRICGREIYRGEPPQPCLVCRERLGGADQHDPS